MVIDTQVDYAWKMPHDDEVDADVERRWREIETIEREVTRLNFEINKLTDRKKEINARKDILMKYIISHDKKKEG